MRDFSRPNCNIKKKTKRALPGPQLRGGGGGGGGGQNGAAPS